MAEYGFEVRGSHLLKQIDDDNPNYGLSAVGTVTFTLDTAVAHPNPMSVAEITVPGNNPLIAFASQQLQINLYSVSKNGNSWTFRFRSRGGGTFTATYYVFDVGNITIGASAPYGIMVRDGFQGLVYHGGLKPLRIVDFVGQTTKTYPAGKTYATIQTCGQIIFARELDEMPVTIPRPGQAIYQHTSYMAGAQVDGTTVSTGLVEFENFESEQPTGTPGAYLEYGQASWLVVDVTGYTTVYSGDYTPNAIDWPDISGSTPENFLFNPGPVRVITGFDQQITVRVTISNVSPNPINFGNHGLYLIKNTVVAGSAPMVNGAWFEAVVSPGDSLNFQLNVDTASGRKTGSCGVTVTNATTGALLDQFNASATVDSDDNYNVADVVPDSIPALANLLPNTPNDTAFGTPRDFRILGINTTITLRVLRVVTGGSGNVARRYLNVSISNDGTNWTLLTTLTAPTEQFDFNVTNGQYVRLTIELSTSAGMVTSQWNIAVYNLSSGGAEIAALTLNGIVDNDNNFNVVDKTLDGFVLGNLTLNTPEPSGTTNDVSFVVAGINTGVDLRFTRLNQWDENRGVTVTRRLSVWHLPAGSSTWSETYVTTASPTYDKTVYNGDTILFRLYVNTVSGKAATSFDVTIQNMSTGGNQIGTFHASAIVDSDDNYNVEDYTPDPISIGQQNITTNDYYGAFGGSWYVTGINQTITIRATVTDRSGNISAGGFYFRKNGADVGSGMLWTSGNDSRETTFNNGDYFEIYIDAQTFSGRKQGQFLTTITNMTTGGVIAQFWTICDVDQNNDYNTADYVPDGISLPNLTVWTNENYADASSGQDARQLTGFNQQITLRLSLVSPTGTVAGGIVRLIRYTPSLGWHEAGIIWLPQGGSVTANFLPGDYVYTDVLAAYTAAGRQDMSFVMQLFNETGGNYLMTQHAVNITVDADDNYYDQVLDSFSLPAMNYSSDTGYGAFQHQFPVFGINKRVALRIVVENVSSGMADGYVYLLNSANGVLWQHHYNDGSADHWFDADPNTYFTIYTDGAGLSVRPSVCTFTVSLYNMSNGGQLLASTTVSGSVRNTSGGPTDPT